MKDEASLVGTERVLVVEDNDALRRVAVSKIAKLGYDVIEAASPTAALRLLDSGVRPDVLFTDIVMPGPLDGLGLAAEAVKRVPGLRVLLTSGFTERSAGGNEPARLQWPMLTKPYRSSELARALRSCVAYRQPVASTGT